MQIPDVVDDDGDEDLTHRPSQSVKPLYEEPPQVVSSTDLDDVPFPSRSRIEGGSSATKAGPEDASSRQAPSSESRRKREGSDPSRTGRTALSAKDKERSRKSSEAAMTRQERAEQRQAEKASRQNLTKADKKIAKLQAKNEQLAAKQQRKEEKAQQKRTDEVDPRDPRRSGRRLGDERAAERAERNRKRYRSYVFRIAIIIVVAFIVIFGAMTLYRSDFLLVKDVHVEGATHLSSSEITETAAVAEGSTLLRLDSDGIVSRLEESPWVQEAHVTRQFPDSIVIHITEREPAAVVRIDKNVRWVISEDCAWLSLATDEDWKNNYHIIDVNTAISKPASGSVCTDDGIVAAVTLLQGLSPDFRDQIKNISAESAAKLSIKLKNGITVAWGDPDETELKEAAVWALLDEYQGKISYINVRIASRPTYRTLQEDEGGNS